MGGAVAAVQAQMKAAPQAAVLGSVAATDSERESSRSPAQVDRWLRFLGIQGIHPKLTISSPADPDEREADAVADRVMRMPDVGVQIARAEPKLHRKCAGCDDEDMGTIARKADGSAANMPSQPQPATAGIGNLGAGLPLPGTERAFFESRFGRDLSAVRIHDGQAAANAARSINARAFAIGNDISFARGEFRPGTDEGRLLLAHELAHTFQHQGEGTIRRFEASEVSKIAPTPQDMLSQIRKLVDAATTNGHLNMDQLVEISGGSSAGRKINAALGSKDPTIPSQMLIRYVYSCRCGLLDMRHFMQLMYIANFNASAALATTSRGATKKGREHELSAEPQSRFSAEDTPTNAIGALTGLILPGIPGPDSVFNSIKDTMARCALIGWSSLSKASQDQIVQFYSDRIPDPAAKKPGDKIPKNQNQTAIPDILPVSECAGGERSLPFELDTGDSDRKTLSGKNFLGGSTAQTSASDMRGFILTQRPEIISTMPLAEKIRYLNKLKSWPMTDDDLEGIKKIYANSTLAELHAEP